MEKSVKQSESEPFEISVAKHNRRRRRRRGRSRSASAVVQPQPQVPSKSEPVEISGDDLTDVSHHLLELGIGLKRDKVADCLRQLGDSLNGFDVSKKAQICLHKFLFSDLNSCGSAQLPSLNSQVLITTLDGPFVLQVDEIINIGFPGFPRRLQLFMTDGAQRVHGFECEPVDALDVFPAPCGLKVQISNVEVIHGRLLLYPQNIRVLGGGLVEQPVDELNTPSRGKRYKLGGGLVEHPVDELNAPSRGKRVDDPVHGGSTLHIAGNLWNREPNKDHRRLLRRLQEEVIFQVWTRKSNSDGLITEGCNETSGLVVCFGEMLIDFVPTVRCLSLAKASPGGAPANVAVGISKLGGSSAFISKVGADEFGYMLDDILQQNNVDTSGMRFNSIARTKSAFVTLRDDDGHKFLFFQNPSANMLLDKSELDHNLIKKAKIFHYGSMSLVDEPCKLAHLAALKIAEDSDCILSYDPSLRLALWPSAEAARNGIMSIWNLAHVIKISEDDITFLIDVGDRYDDDVIFKKLFQGNLKLLIVTKGWEGRRYYTKDFKGEVNRVNVEPVDTTGAGDAFVSGILYKIASDPSIFKDVKRLQDALYFANVCAAITVTERGAIPALPTKDAVVQFYAKAAI